MVAHACTFLSSGVATGNTVDRFVTGGVSVNVDVPVVGVGVEVDG